MALIPLSRQTLPQLPIEVTRPTFDLTRVRTGIVHLGFGGFHRAHMARYTHDLMQRGDALDWGILGVGLLPQDRRMQEALAPQDALYTLVERDDAEEDVTVIGCVTGVVFAAESSRDALQAIARPETRIVSMTVTENGYCLNPSTKLLDFSHPAISRDLADPRQPQSTIGILVESFRRRMAAGESAMTALTCDNIQHNGAVLRAAALSFAERCDPALARWIEINARFPNTMVDRITPITSTADTDYLRSRYGVQDRWPVFSESFRQWVVEDTFVQGRPLWENVGTQFVTDVAPYEVMKLRLLNASHLALAGLGRLAGLTFIREVVNDVAFRAYMQTLMDRETGPTLSPVPGVDVENYKQTLIARFANPNIKDTCDRVNADAPINLLIDPIRERLAASAGIDLLALGLAAWMKRVAGLDDSGLPIANIHPLSELLRSRAVEGGPNPRPLLSIDSLFGELIENERFVATVSKWLSSLYAMGAKASLDKARRELRF